MKVEGWGLWRFAVAARRRAERAGRLFRDATTIAKMSTIAR